MKVALVYPPTADPTMPYLSVPLLAACLRREGISVITMDANAEAYDRLLRPAFLKKVVGQVRGRLAYLEGRRDLSHGEELELLALWQARPFGDIVLAEVERAVVLMRDPKARRFYDPPAYGRAVEVLKGALGLISAAYYPLDLGFGGYRTPFSLLSAQEITRDAHPERNPFHGYFSGELSRRLGDEGVGLVGLSVAFPGQIQPAFALAYELRRSLPGVYLTVGGPAITQMLVRLSGEALGRALGPFDSAVLFEGERALVQLVRDVQGGQRPRGILEGDHDSDLAALPAPDFAGLDLSLYLSPEPVLPYDASRGCPWGRCAFCHYGLAGKGCAAYRERPLDQVVRDMEELRHKHGSSIIYLSQDTYAPKTALALATMLKEGGPRWATDMRAERYLTADRCREMAKGGLLAVSLGVESGAQRVLNLLDKGTTLRDMRGAILSLAQAGIAVEAMAFTNFPTETTAEALSTIQLLGDLADSIALFMCGEFQMTWGSRVAQTPQPFGVREVFGVEGDELGTGTFYQEVRDRKGERGREEVDMALERLSRLWLLRPYPFAGSLSTAHTLLYYNRLGPGTFRRLASRTVRPLLGPVTLSRSQAALARVALERERKIWQTLIWEQRRVSRKAYQALVPSRRGRGR